MSADGVANGDDAGEEAPGGNASENIEVLSGNNTIETENLEEIVLSASSDDRQLTVCVRDAYKQYGNPLHPVPVLKGLDMTVPKGTIYALLGASGCGKTTLLSCILGQKSLNDGKIWILGGSPGSKPSGVPGPRVGYMPQQIALYGDFTIKETLFYYGWILGMANSQIADRYTFLKELLMLPETDQLVKHLSGGQQRRVSLASALLHEPELLILDEPTVGVDPILRETIWLHLIELAKGGQRTIVMTTHYIEEARRANIVGLMRGGCLLAEEPPAVLMAHYKSATLEEVFLKLSLDQNYNSSERAKEFVVTFNGCSSKKAETSDTLSGATNDDDERISIRRKSSEGEEEEKESLLGRKVLPPMPADEPRVSGVADCLPKIDRGHMKALIWKGLLWMMRNVSPMLCVILLPVSQIAVYCLAIGHDPVNLAVAVVNHETNNSANCDAVVNCSSTQLSCAYLGYLEKRALNLIYYDNDDEAIESVTRGLTYASITVKHNYSAALKVRIKNAFKMYKTPKSWDIEASQVDVYRDVSSKHIATQLKAYLYDSFQTFVQDYVESCGKLRRHYTVPIKWETPIYGIRYPNFTEFALPGILMIITFFLAVATTSFGMLIERNEGSFERTFVLGITEIELLIAHIACQSFIMAMQCVGSIVCTFVVFQMTMKGSYVLLLVHNLITGFAGMCYGLLVSCLCDREETAMYLALGSVLPLLFMCGIIWPLEALHPWLQPFADFLPLTLGTESLRSILQRSWGLSSATVWLGLVSLLAWTVVFLLVSVAFLKIKKSEDFDHLLSVAFARLRKGVSCRRK